MTRFVGDPQGELRQNMDYHRFYENLGGYQYHFPDIGISRSAPAEQPFVHYDKDDRIWLQGDSRMPHGWRPKMHWARPVDGKRRGFMGRLMDGLTNEGADVFVVMSGDKRMKSRENPHREQWSRWGGPVWNKNWGCRNIDHDYVAQAILRHMPGAAQRGRYNFSTRKYEDSQTLRTNYLGNNLVTDAYWPDDAKRKDPIPTSFRTLPDLWRTQVPRGAGFFPGGRPMRL